MNLSTVNVFSVFSTHQNKFVCLLVIRNTCNWYYSQTWANDHLWIAATCIQRPSFIRSQFEILLLKWPPNDYHLPTTATIPRSQGWSLYTGLQGIYKFKDVIVVASCQENPFLV